MHIFLYTCAKVLEYPGVGVIYSSEDMLNSVRDKIYPRVEKFLYSSKDILYPLSDLLYPWVDIIFLKGYVISCEGYSVFTETYTYSPAKLFSFYWHSFDTNGTP